MKLKELKGHIDQCTSVKINIETYGTDFKVREFTKYAYMEEAITEYGEEEDWEIRGINSWTFNLVIFKETNPEAHSNHRPADRSEDENEAQK